MIVNYKMEGKNYTIDLAKPIDIAIPLQTEVVLEGSKVAIEAFGNKNPNCFNAPFPQFTPVEAGSFIGDTRQGGTVNFYNVQYNPHGNGTHTESVGHISKERYYINDCLQQFHSIGLLITITPQKYEGDLIITKEQLKEKLAAATSAFDSLIIRTIPNTIDKLTQNYSNTNPAYFTEEAMEYIVSIGVQHLIVDLPSVDKEVDEGKLSAHHIFWNYPTQPRLNATITELVYIADTVADGLYLVNHQIMPIALDASSSKVVLFQMIIA